MKKCQRKKREAFKNKLRNVKGAEERQRQVKKNGGKNKDRTKRSLCEKSYMKEKKRKRQMREKSSGSKNE